MALPHLHHHLTSLSSVQAPAPSMGKPPSAAGLPSAPTLRSSGSPSLLIPNPPPIPPNVAGLLTAPLTVPAVGSPTAPSLWSSGSPSVPTPSSLFLAQNRAGLPTAPPFVLAMHSPTAPSRGAMVHLRCLLHLHHHPGQYTCPATPAPSSAGSV